MDAANAVGRLAKEPVMKAGFKLSYSFNWNEKTGSTETVIHPDEVPFRSFLLALRHFLLERSPVYWGRVYNQIQVHCSDEKLRRAAIGSREHLSAALKTGPMQLAIDGQAFSPKRVLDIYLNGHYFHLDKDYGVTAEKLEEAFGTATRHVLMLVCHDIARALLHMGAVCRAIVGGDLII